MVDHPSSEPSESDDTVLDLDRLDIVDDPSSEPAWLEADDRPDSDGSGLVPGG